jgi:hypothetical protein
MIVACGKISKCSTNLTANQISSLVTFIMWRYIRNCCCVTFRDTFATHLYPTVNAITYSGINGLRVIGLVTCIQIRQARNTNTIKHRRSYVRDSARYLCIQCCVLNTIPIPYYGFDRKNIESIHIYLHHSLLLQTRNTSSHVGFWRQQDDDRCGHTFCKLPI